MIALKRNSIMFSTSNVLFENDSTYWLGVQQRKTYHTNVSNYNLQEILDLNQGMKARPIKLPPRIILDQ